MKLEGTGSITCSVVVFGTGGVEVWVILCDH